ncbi:PfaD family polyunsaturated fatty acid/polyketide biosynthesis protein [Psychromonas sp. RZ22]|uniref:PfaD family polyunsaturated fatty acid/polyketide biosynthesis protein n=1 Tax=Psychromonas algarum TaxID=2555643 RepID=UPI0010683B90|nr:PfaD family polyunsaturated fatty acid/polyketide biosynthesis protein [Psychromonas sp. RZ22]TEW55935.1 PfaD family polyunsaturated fatty acid/polyketide biosynthesis protein [Psychromonas sp. RZ22]
MTQNKNKTPLITSNQAGINWNWDINTNTLMTDEHSVKKAFLAIDKPLYLAQSQTGEIGATHQLQESASEMSGDVVAFAQAINAKELGCNEFKRAHGVKYAYHGGAMANGIASVELVIALGQAGFLCSFGAAGLIPDVIEESIKRIQRALPNGPFAVNLIHAPSEEALESGAVERFLKLGVNTVEASAFLGLTEHIVYYRVAGLSQNADGSINIKNKVIAKISRTEVAEKFMSPAPQKILDKLLAAEKITALQAKLALQVPMADDITAEADSGGHTDNRPFLTLLPTIIQQRDQIQARYDYVVPLRVGAGGGVGTPESMLAAYNMGAAYVVLGSVNQACVEAGASEHTRKLLANVEMADVTMAPAADMFEMGVKLQVVKRGSMFAMRANKLYELYSNYPSIEAIPAVEREKIEKQIFRQNLDQVWETTMIFFHARDPEMLARVKQDPKRKMALIFRWYLGLSSRWSNIGEKGREMDYQIWAGPSLGAFNSWVKNTYLADYEQRKAVDVALHLLTGAAYLQRINQLKYQGISIHNDLLSYHPSAPF